MGILSREPKEMPATPLLATEQNFKELYSRFKIEMLLTNGAALCHYGNEANATVDAMVAGTAKEVLLNAKQGFEDCQAFEKQYRNSYAVAVLYRRNRRDHRWHPVNTYGPQGEVLQQTPLKFEKHITRCTLEMRANTIHIVDLEVLSDNTLKK